jgi:hypothetical protein
MQLLVRFDTQGYDAWKSAFDGDSEDRMNAGLTLLQLWRDADNTSTAWALFEANARGKAEAWLQKESGLGASTTHHFLSTA